MHQHIDLHQSIDGRPRIRPPPLQYVVGHHTPLDVNVVHIGDFELAAPRGFNGPYDIEHVIIVKIDTDDGIVADWFFGFLHYMDDPVSLDLRHAVILRVIDLLQENLRSPGLPLEGMHRLVDVPFDNVIAQHDHEFVILRKVLGQ